MEAEGTKKQEIDKWFFKYRHRKTTFAAKESFVSERSCWTKTQTKCGSKTSRIDMPQYRNWKVLHHLWSGTETCTVRSPWNALLLGTWNAQGREWCVLCLLAVASPGSVRTSSAKPPIVLQSRNGPSKPSRFRGPAVGTSVWVHEAKKQLAVHEASSVAAAVAIASPQQWRSDTHQSSVTFPRDNLRKRRPVISRTRQREESAMLRNCRQEIEGEIHQLCSVFSRQDNYWVTSHTKGHSKQTMKALIGPGTKRWDLEPKLASLRWWRTHADETKEDMPMETEKGRDKIPCEKSFKIPANIFTQTGGIAEKYEIPYAESS